MVDSKDKRAFQRRALVRLTLLLAIAIVTRVLTWTYAEQAVRSEDSNRHTLQVDAALGRLRAELRTAQSNRFSYLLTGDKSFLAPYRRAAQNARNGAADVTVLTADNPNERHAFGQINPLILSRLSSLDSEVDSRSKSDFDMPAAKAAQYEDQRFTETIRPLMADMFREGSRLLKLQDERLHASKQRFAWSLMLGNGIGLLIIWGVYSDIKRYSNQAVAAEERLTELNSELNERVRNRTAMLAARGELLDCFVKHTPAAVAMLDRGMRYIHATDRWCAFFGVASTQMMGKSLYEISPDIPEHWIDAHRRCLAGETIRVEEDRWDGAHGTSWVRWEVRPWGQGDGNPEGMLIWAEDITARKLTEEKLRESEATTRTLLDTAAQAILATDANGTIVLANRMVGTMFGYDPSELVGQSKDILIPERFRSHFRTFRAEFFANPGGYQTGATEEVISLRKDGTEFPAETNLSSVETKQGLFAVSFISDMTSRNEAAAELHDREEKLRSLAGTLLSAQEDERRNLARELHDDVMQRLAILSIELGSLSDMLPNSSDEALERVQRLQRQALRASSEVRRISRGLHPSIITDFGLSIALEAFCEEFEKAQGIRVSFVGPTEDSRLNNMVATCLYRIAQESMRNAAVHGRATQIRVALSQKEGTVQLRVADNGIGFMVPPTHSATGMGIMSMKERTRLVNGTLNLSSQPGQGAVITASVPIGGFTNDAG